MTTNRYVDIYKISTISIAAAVKKVILLQVYVCEDCGHTTKEPEVHYVHLKEQHPYSPALLKFYDKRHFKFNNSNFASMLLQCSS